jgi:DNA-directed RNA polymerase
MLKLKRGFERYHNADRAAADAGELTQAQGKVFHSYFEEVLSAIRVAYIDANLNKRGRPSTDVEALRAVDLERLAAHTLKTCCVGAGAQEPVANVFRKLGEEIEIEMLAVRVRENFPEEYKEITKWEVRDHHGRDARIEQFRKLDGQEAFDETKRFQLGRCFANMAIKGTHLFYTSREGAELGDVEAVDENGLRTFLFTPEALEAIETVVELQQYMAPEFQAMRDQPTPWTNYHTGAYKARELAERLPFMKSRSKRQIGAVGEAIQNDAPFVQAVNAIQKVALQINERVLGVLKHVWENDIAVGEKIPARPVKGMKRKDFVSARSKRAAIRRDLSVVDRYLGGAMFQPAQVDFRGRVYAVPGFNHQRSDYCKGLFESAVGQKLNADGVEWLKWHAATTNAQKIDGVALDKMAFEKRVAWTDANLSDIMDIAMDPLETMDLWMVADSPFCFLAACFDLAGYYADPVNHISRTFVAIDGSCSGLQHYSAMLRDVQGATRVNLVPGDASQDVYAYVAGLVVPKVQEALNDPEVAESAALWLKYGIDRKVTKRAVMTYVYGSRKQGFRKQLVTDIIRKDAGKAVFGSDKEDEKSYSKHAEFLAGLIEEAVATTVPAAASAMKYLQDLASKSARHNVSIRWETHMGLYVENAYRTIPTKVVRCEVWSKAQNVMVMQQATIPLAPTNQLDQPKQRNSIAPNFIHSMDAAHLQSVAVAAVNEGIEEFLMIHDSFASLPNHMPRFSKLVRETFVQMYETMSPLEQITERVAEDLLEVARAETDVKVLKKITTTIKEIKELGIPQRGSFDLSSVLDSSFAFA